MAHRARSSGGQLAGWAPQPNLAVPMKVIRVTKPAAFASSEVRTLLHEAILGGARGVGHRNPERVIDKIAANLGSPGLGFFIGLEEGKVVSVLSCALPPDPATDYPMFDLAAHHGSSALRKAMIAAGVAFFKAAGYNEAVAINFSGHDDGAYIRMGKRIGLTLTKHATVMKVTF
jgi:hypothetical protein